MDEGPRRRTGKPVLVLLLVLPGAALLALSGWAIYEARQRADLCAAGKEASAAGRWTEALAAFHRLAQLDPGNRDVLVRREEALGHVLHTVPGGQDLSAELGLLRWLAAEEEWDHLAEALDRCEVMVPADQFWMGSDGGRADETPRRLVYLDAFAIGRYEVSNVQYQRFLRASGRRPPLHWSGSDYPPGQADFPVVGVDWSDADAYCVWAGRRLPSEAEWEKACAGPGGRVFPWGDGWEPRWANAGSMAGASLPRPANLSETWGLLLQPQGKGPALGLRPLGSYPEGASPYGVLDLVGNASEWVADWYNWNGYRDLPPRNPLSTGPPWNHALRGSSWIEVSGRPDWIQERSRCSARNSSHSSTDPRAGFRCARSIP